MRSTVWAVSWVCRVANTRWPVSAAVSAVEIVSRSRISPTRITSGSWRSAALSASAKLCASAPSSRWLTMQLLCRCRNSIGSSIVMMCSWRSSLITSIIAASVVDLPEPVGPVTSTKPRGLLVKLRSIAGQAEGVQRRHRPAGSGGRPRRSTRAGSRRSRGSGPCRGSSRRGRSASRSPASGAGRWTGSSRRSRAPPAGSARARRSAAAAPRLRSIGGEPAVRCRSEAPVSSTSMQHVCEIDLHRRSPIGSSRGLRDPCDLGDRGDPLLDPVEAVVAQRAHALLDRHATDLVGRRALDGQRRGSPRTRSSPRTGRSGPCSRCRRSALQPTGS